MKQDAILTIMSLLAILLTTLHLALDIVHGISPGGLTNLTGLFFWVVWLYATLVLAERRSGYVIMLLGSLLGSVVPLAHMRGAGLVGGRIAGSSGVHFWVWTLMALGVAATFSLILSARGLWTLRRGKSR